MQVGYHVGVSDGKFLGPLIDSITLGANAGQIFLGSPKSYKCKLYGYEITDPIKEFVDRTNYYLICHSPYILNFAREVDEYILDRYAKDLININRMGGVGSVLHMGFNVKSLNKTHDQACRTFVDNLEKIAEKTPKDSIIILENMAGKGTSMCCKMKEWGEFWNDYIDESLKKRIKWCVDTAHLWGVGEYNLSKRREINRFYEDFDENIGWENIECFHYNGSSVDLGACKDAHASIELNKCGKIETKGMRHLARVAKITSKPLILEVPGHPYPQLELIKSWKL